jgi:hypothetical protein
MTGSGADDGIAKSVDWIGVAALTSIAFLVGFGESLFGGSPEERQRAQRIAVGLLCFLCAFLWFHVRRLGRRVRDAEDLLADVRFGPGTKRDRDAVDILVQALRVSDPGARETALRTLKKISGLDLGADPRPWEEWWSAARSSFVRAGGPPPAPKK